MDKKIYDEHDKIEGCACSKAGVLMTRIGLVGKIIAVGYQNAIREFALCPKTRAILLEYTIISMVTQITLDGTVIEPGSPESLNEFEHVITGIEARLLARARDLYATATPELLEKTQRELVDFFARNGEVQ